MWKARLQQYREGLAARDKTLQGNVANLSLPYSMLSTCRAASRLI